ncbi:uncharacterized protein LOC132290239 [Cornus florida]|uniref:uncharacterized protein LOC132290239 n=1 Tax=Cornus florida TaxID=4283 RepID=UPI0028A28A81|nr:uncharacterized protein LOC132290239 [Cornus florida]
MAISQISMHLEPWCDLNGKVVMVTGASSGIGRDFCLDLAKAGCKVIAAARRIERLKSLCDQINQFTLSRDPNSTTLPAMPVELDVSADATTVEASVQTAWDAFGRIDALINNAGVRGGVHSLLDLSEEEWNNTFKTNLTGSWLVSKYVCIRMRDANIGGSIINISSIAGLYYAGQKPGSIAYSSSKAGVNAMTKVMAIELAQHRIRVNAVAPGLFRSEITEGLMQKEWLNNVAFKSVPLRTYGTANPALTSIVRYLVHDSSEYVSGNIFTVDAGSILPGVPIFSSL